MNLIGEHVDYCGGAVLPMPIQLGTTVCAAPNGFNEVRVFSTRMNDRVTIRPETASFVRGHWASYALGVVRLLERRGRIAGADVHVDSDLCMSGLSSSASFTIALMQALAGLSGLELGGIELAQAARAVEHEFAGVPCGLMDQAAVVLTPPRAALLFDCATLVWQAIPWPEASPRVLVVDSGMPRSLAATAYELRLAETGRAGAALGIPRERLATADPDRLDACRGLDATAVRRARHVVQEHRRVLAAVDAVRSGAWHRLGALFQESHESLRTLYDVSSSELDALVESANRQPGVYGARLTGAGFGGAIVALVEADLVLDAAAGIGRDYERGFGRVPNWFVADPQGGAREI